MTNPAIPWLNRLVLALAALYFVYDLSRDLSAGDPWVHFVPELAVFTLVLIALAAEILAGIRLRSLLRDRQQQLSELRGCFADRIRAQFQRWQLTQSETEVAWLIVKGFSFSEIARLRDVKEKTVRQQATVIYAKSGTSNRNDLSAVFIEDLLSNEP